MTTAVRTEHLKRYRDIARLLWRHGRSDLVHLSGLDAELDDSDRGETTVPPEADELALDLERMGPTFIKLGQLLSTRADLLPASYIQALERLQDNVEPFPYSEVERIVNEELGVRLSKAFAELDPTPIASASLGQVHRALLRDGREVAVKVQRPGIREQALADLEVFQQIAEVAERRTEAGKNYRLTVVAEEFQRSLLRELDYLREASHLEALRRNLAEYDRLVIPAPISDYTTSRVLTMERIHGTKIDRLSPLLRTELPVRELVDQLLGAYLKQIVVDGLFHADPHPGNVLLTRDHRIALLDLGMVGHVPPGMQEQLLKLLVAVTDGRGDEAADLLVRIGSPRKDFDLAGFRRRVAELVAENLNTPIAQLQVGRVVLRLVTSANAAGVDAPSELALLGKTLLNLDQVVRSLDPDLDVNQAVRRHLTQIIQRRFLRSTSPAGLFSMVSESKELVEQMPSRLNRILDLVAQNQLRVDVDAINETELIKGFQKIANRIAGGVIVAALIIGAALMMRVQTPFTLLGFPGIPMIFFLIAAGWGTWMMWEILRHDR